MKKFLVSLIVFTVVCLIMSLAYADVTGERIAQDIDANGNIRVWTVYRIDGKEVESLYSKINGHSVYVSGRYSKRQFNNMTTSEIKDKIDADIHSHNQNLVGKEFDKNAVKSQNQIRIDYNAQANQDFLNSTFPPITGDIVSDKEKKISIDTNNDGVLDTELTLKQDGTKTTNPILTP